MASRSLRPLLAVLLAAPLVALCGAAGGCGGRDPDAAAADRTAWKPTFDAAMDALGRRDYRAFTDLMTPTGRATLDRELRLFAKMLADPVEGPRLLGLVRARWPDVPEPLVAAARGGDAEAAWRLFLGAATPAGVTPRQAGLRLDPKDQDTMSLRYRYSEGDDLGFEMRRIRGRWYVDAIELRKTS
jgi:hypothetical protein